MAKLVAVFIGILPKLMCVKYFVFKINQSINHNADSNQIGLWTFMVDFILFFIV